MAGKLAAMLMKAAPGADRGAADETNEGDTAPADEGGEHDGPTIEIDHNGIHELLMGKADGTPDSETSGTTDDGQRGMVKCKYTHGEDHPYRVAAKAYKDAYEAAMAADGETDNVKPDDHEEQSDGEVSAGLGY